MPSSPLLPLSTTPTPRPPAPSPSSSPPLALTPRSAKSLGKRQQTDVSPISPPPAPKPKEPRHVMIRFTDGGAGSGAELEREDLGLWVEEGSSVKGVKRQIRSLRPSLSTRQLRLIHAGRVLSPDVKLVGWLDSLAKRTADAQDPRGKGKGKEGVIELEEMVWIHCAVGLEEEQVEGGDGADGEQEEGREIPQIAPLRGFDTLRSTAGLSEQDVAAMRRQFHGLTEEEELDDSARNLEEQWIDGNGGMPGGAEDLLPSETYTTILQGLLTGFFFPLLPLFFFKDAEQHSFISPGPLAEGAAGSGVIFSRRMQVSLMLGLALNVGFGFLRYLG